MFSSEVLASGKLLLIGGGKRPLIVLDKMIELAGTGTGEILIIPLASEIPAEVAASAKVELAGAGARSVSIYSCTTANVDRVDCLTQIIAAR